MESISSDLLESFWHNGDEISYHATTGIKHPPPVSWLDQCSAKAAGVDAFDRPGRLGLLHVALPLNGSAHDAPRRPLRGAATSVAGASCCSSPTSTLRPARSSTRSWPLSRLGRGRHVQRVIRGRCRPDGA